MSKPWKEHIEEVKPYVPGKSIEEIKSTYGIEDVIKMASNESAVQPPARVLEAVEKAASDLRTYPDSTCKKLREKLSAKYSIRPESLIFGNGSDEVIVMAARAFLDSSSEVILPEPTFLYYKIVSASEGARVRTVGMNKDFTADVKGILEAVTDKTRLIFISNPNNPTGSMLKQESLQELIENIHSKVALFIDEAYFEFLDEKDRADLYDQLDRKDRIIIISRTFSKAYALAGLRIGYGMMRSDVCDILNRIRAPFNVNSVAQAAACAALDCEDHFLKEVEKIKKEKIKLYKELDKLGLGYVRSFANFVLIDTKRSSQEVCGGLLRKGIIVRDMSAWGLRGCLRVNLSLPENNERFIEGLKEIVEKTPVSGGSLENKK